jgi:hypothetical protein
MAVTASVLCGKPPFAELAEQIGLNPIALGRMLIRARRRDDPRALKMPYTPTGIVHIQST